MEVVFGIVAMMLVFGFIKTAVCVGLLAAAIYSRKLRRQQSLAADGKSVCITGCSSGFGRAAALQLKALGFTVFAVCRNPKGSEIQGEECETLRVIRGDVTKEEDVIAIRDYCDKWNHDHGLRMWGLVNNAGNSFLASSEFVPIEKTRELFKVNYFACVRLTQVMLPLLRRGGTDGRIVNISSESGYLRLWNMSSYASTKVALTHFSRSLQVELRQFGLRVINIAPALFLTGMADVDVGANNMERMNRDVDKDVFEAYGGEEGLKYRSDASKRNLKRAVITGIQPCLDTYIAALTHTDPEPVYRPGVPVSLIMLSWLVQALPARLASALEFLFLKAVRIGV